MKKKDFDNLLLGVKQLGAVIRGEMKPTREFYHRPGRVKDIRVRLKLSQTEFARAIGVPTGTLRNWEQGVRKPKGPARALLAVADRHPEAVLDALYGRRTA